MNRLLALNTSLQFKSHAKALEYARLHLPREEYERIRASYNAVLKKTAFFTVCICLPIILVFVLLAIAVPLTPLAMPTGATHYVDARVDYDGNFYWTHDSKKYERPLVAYDLDPSTHPFNSRIRVYLDDGQEVIAVTEKPSFDVRSLMILVTSILAIAIPVVLLICVHDPRARRTYGRAWYEFYEGR